MSSIDIEKQIDEFVKQNKQDILEDIASLVAIKSVEDAPKQSAPFGDGVKQALLHTLDIAAKMGLSVKNCESYAGYAELSGEDCEKHIGMICHVDVVPEGNGWDGDPFVLRQREGWLLGRGTADDKGPMIMSLYALKFIKEAGIKLRYPIRAIVGCNEETGMKDVEYYLKHNKAPAFCFTPDAEFPVCNGEKGHFTGKIVSRYIGGSILEIEGGVANNAVPDRANVLIKCEKLLKGSKDGSITISDEGNGAVRINGFGKSGHAASPQDTVNAIGLIVDYILENGLCENKKEELEFLKALQKLHSATDGSGLGIACSDEPFGALTIIGGRIYTENGRIVQTFDCRYPTTTNGEILEKAMKEALGSAADLADISSNEPFYISAESPAIKALIETYNTVTGEDAKPFTMGGGTYARHFPYAVSYGPERNDTVLPKFGGPMHGANEAAPLDKLLEALKIYILALLRLQEIDL